ncbi:MAG: 50S ribosome-binding GTPase, partial [Phycisphaerales bacterium]|nr:50S ribosome-binding GTPase [Phycisphaerales bacterium]
ALLGRPRAIVSDVAGTTRDVLAEPLTIPTDHGPAEIMLIDLAGTEDPATALDERMQAAARETIERADLVLHCVPAHVDVERVEILHLDTSAVNVLRIRTQIDRASTPIDDHALSISAVTGVGMDELRARIVARLADRAVSLAADAFAILPRHESHLREAAEHLHETIECVDSQCGMSSLDDAELLAMHLRSALDAMASLAGDITPDDVLGRVFATFCVGK